MKRAFPHLSMLLASLAACGPPATAEGPTEQPRENAPADGTVSKAEPAAPEEEQPSCEVDAKAEMKAAGRVLMLNGKVVRDEK